MTTARESRGSATACWIDWASRAAAGVIHIAHAHVTGVCICSCVYGHLWCYILLTDFSLDHLERRNRDQAAYLFLWVLCAFCRCWSVWCVLIWMYLWMLTGNECSISLTGWRWGHIGAASLHLLGYGIWQPLRESFSLSTWGSFFEGKKNSLCASLLLGMDLLLPSIFKPSACRGWFIRTSTNIALQSLETFLSYDCVTSYFCGIRRLQKELTSRRITNHET